MWHRRACAVQKRGQRRVTVIVRVELALGARQLGLELGEFVEFFVEQGGVGSQSAVPIGREILEAAFHVGRYAPDAQQDAAAGK